MKALKIILTIAVVALIVFFATKWFTKIDSIPKSSIPPPSNQYTIEIQRKIDSLPKIPNNVFSKSFYKNIQAGIDDFYINGSLGLTPYKDGSVWKDKEDDNNNNQWKEILSKNLYSAYAPKFVEQAMYVFGLSEWKYDDLQFIRSEVNSLKSSPYLGNTGLITSFEKIDTILAKYDEILRFINDSKGFTYPNYNLENTYPNVSEKIKKSRSYIANNLDNNYVNNCTRLKKELQAIPEILFNKHINYLTKKINNHGPNYIKFNYQSDYVKIINSPLRVQLATLSNDIYGIDDSVFEKDKESVDSLLSRYNRDAIDFFKNKKN